MNVHHSYKVMFKQQILSCFFSSVNDFDASEGDKVTKGFPSRSQEKGHKWSTNRPAQDNTINCQRDKKNRSSKESHGDANLTVKDDCLQRLVTCKLVFDVTGEIKSYCKFTQ